MKQPAATKITMISDSKASFNRTQRATMETEKKENSSVLQPTSCTMLSIVSTHIVPTTKQSRESAYHMQKRKHMCIMVHS